MPNFTGQLNANMIFASIYNMIISQQVFADNIAGTFSNLVEKARVDGTMYGDTKTYYSTDVLKSSPWGNDAEAVNLLKLHRPKAPAVQGITVNIFRQVRLTVDYYLTKQAWMGEGAFTSFTSVMLGWMRETKKIYESTTYNAFIGTTVSSANRAIENITLSTITSDASLNTKEKNELKAQTIAESMANLFVDMTDTTRDFNDYKHLRSYNLSDIKVIWNSAYVNKIKKLQLPTIFNKDGLMEKFDEDVLPERFFGTLNTSSGTTASTNTTIRTMIETDYQVADASVDARAELADDGNYYVHVFGGDLLPKSTAYAANETYTATDDIICKVYVKLPPIMSGFTVGTSFFNARALTETHFLTWGHNTLERLYNYPLITVKEN